MVGASPGSAKRHWKSGKVERLGGGYTTRRAPCRTAGNVVEHGRLRRSTTVRTPSATQRL